MSNFDLKKFLAEGKLYKENLADTRMEAEGDARIFHKDLVTKYGFDAVADALEAAYDNAEEGGMDYENIADTFKMDNSILISMIEDTLAEGMSKPTKMKMSELKKKIREEILSELTLEEDTDIDFDGGAETEGPDGENVDPVAEATKDGDGEVPSKDADTDIDIEDKEEVKVDVEKKPKMSGPSNKFLDQLEILKKEADAMGDNKLERQIDNTITYFTRQHIAKDIDESIELEEADRDYYDAAERDDAAHIAALEKDMEDDKRSSLNEAEGKLVDEKTGKEVTLPYNTLDFRGDKITVTGFKAPHKSGSTGKIYTKDGGEYYPGVAGLKIIDHSFSEDLNESMFPLFKKIIK